MFRRSLLWLLPATLPALAATFVLWPSSHNAHATCFGGNPTYSAWSDVVPTGIPVYHRITWISFLGCSPAYGAIDWTFEQYATAYSPYQYQSWRTWNCVIAWNNGQPSSSSGSNYATDYVDYTYTWCGLQADTNAYWQAYPGNGGLWHYLKY